jgi:hypothetical protein
MAISLISLPVTLNNIYMQTKHKVSVGTKKTMFVLQLFSSSLWITLGVMNKQWFMLLSASNNIVQTICILYLISELNNELKREHEEDEA